MNKIILFLVIILGILIYLYINKQENLTKSSSIQSSSNIWKVGETLNVGDVKSSPNGMYKFVVTTNGLEIYNYNWKKFNLYPSLIGPSNKNNNTQVSYKSLFMLKHERNLTLL